MKPSAVPDEHDLFRRIAEGDEVAFEIIFHNYSPKLRPFIIGIVKLEAVADDVLQTIFLKVWLNRQTLVYVHDPSAWLYRVTSNTALNELRKQAAEYKKLKQTIVEGGENPDDLLEQLSAKQLQEWIQEAVMTLPDKRKEIYLLTREEGLSHRQIAHKLGISVSTVKNQVVLALKNIQEHILKNTGLVIPVILLSKIILETE